MTGRNYINGQWTKASGQPFSAVNPATGTTTWTGNSSDVSDVNTAVAAARAATGEWRNTTIVARIKIIERFGKLVKAASVVTRNFALAGVRGPSPLRARHQPAKSDTLKA